MCFFHNKLHIYVIVFMLISLFSTTNSTAYPGGCKSPPKSAPAARFGCGGGKCRQSCLSGFILSSGNRREILKCQNGEWITFDCIARCNPSCKNGGKCVAPNKCACPATFIGNHCESEFIPCKDIFVEPFGGFISKTEQEVIIECDMDYETPSGYDIAMSYCVSGEWNNTEEMTCSPICDECEFGTTCVEPFVCACGESPKKCAFATTPCLTYNDAVPIMIVKTFDKIEKEVCEPKGQKVIKNEDDLNLTLECSNNIWVPRYSEVGCVASCEPACANGGTCTGRHQCICTAQFTGEYCQDIICQHKPPLVRRGYYNISSNEAILKCESGFKLNTLVEEVTLACQNMDWAPVDGTSLMDIHCIPVCFPPCFNGGKCIAPNKCKCTEGFTGEKCVKKWTTSDSGDCVFPFLYFGQVYYSCTSIDYHLPWCATSVYNNSQLKTWGKCFSELETTRFIRTTSGKVCIFPFLDGDFFYEDCARDNSTMSPWCAVKTTVSNQVLEKGVCDYEAGLEVAVHTTNGKTCYFPFKYKGQTHLSCITMSINSGLTGVSWCPTQSNLEEKDYCISDYGISSTQYTTTGKLCRFPFKFNGTLHSTCIIMDGQKMCPTELNGNVPVEFDPCIYSSTVLNRFRKFTSMRINDDSQKRYALSVKLIRTVKGEECILPFKHQGKFHFKCAVHENLFNGWCPTKVDQYYEVVRKGTCAPDHAGFQYWYAKFRQACQDLSSTQGIRNCLNKFRDLLLSTSIDSVRGWKAFIDKYSSDIRVFIEFELLLDYSFGERPMDKRNVLFLLDKIINGTSSNRIFTLKNLIEFDTYIRIAKSGLTPESSSSSEGGFQHCLAFIYDDVLYEKGECVKLEISVKEVPWKGTPTDLWCAAKVDDDMKPIIRVDCNAEGGSEDRDDENRTLNMDIPDLMSLSSSSSVKTRSGKFCKFPFLYNGRVYTTCVEGKGEGAESWCAISITSTFQILNTDVCRRDYFEPSRQIKTDKGYNCIFPFEHNNELINDECVERTQENPVGRCIIQVNNTQAKANCLPGDRAFSRNILTLEGYRCHFPFYYNNIEYHSCVSTSVYDPGWCATTVDKSDNPLTKGKCILNFYASVRRQRTVTGKVCSFPFKASNRNYIDSCARDAKHSTGWCYVMNNGNLVMEKCRENYTSKSTGCKFPFTFEGKTYHSSCVTISSFDPGWCYTQSKTDPTALVRMECRYNDNTNMIKTTEGEPCTYPWVDNNFFYVDSCEYESRKNNGVCKCASCDSEEMKKCSSIPHVRINTVHGRRCSFPFIMNNKLYQRSCARTSIYDAGVCATKKNKMLIGIEYEKCKPNSGATKVILSRNGRPCIFPMVFKNITYVDSCFEDPLTKLRKCATSVDWERNPIQSDYCVTATDTKSEDECIFPFVYNGTKYTKSCVRVSEFDPGWCFSYQEGKEIRKQCTPQQSLVKLQFSLDGRLCQFPALYDDGWAADYCDGASYDQAGSCFVRKMDSEELERAGCLNSTYDAIQTAPRKPCLFPFTHNNITYRRGCVKTSDYDPGWCFIGNSTEGLIINATCYTGLDIPVKKYAVSGQACVFPYIYNNVTYVDNCFNQYKDVFNSVGWCATEVDDNGEATLIEKCLSIKEEELVPESRIRPSLETPKTISGKSCVPFLYNSIYYSRSCVRISHYDPGWCAVEVDQDLNPTKKEDCSPGLNTAIIETISENICSMPFDDNGFTYHDSCVSIGYKKPFCFVGKINDTEECDMFEMNPDRWNPTTTTPKPETTTSLPSTEEPCSDESVSEDQPQPYQQTPKGQKELKYYINSDNQNAPITVNLTPNRMAPFNPSNLKINLNLSIGVDWAGPGQSTEEPCLLPFMYKGNLHHSCTTLDSAIPWCPTQISTDRKVRKAKYCTKESQEMPLIFTIKGHKCQFPFFYKGLSHTSCIDIDAPEYWCVTMQDSMRIPLSGDVCVGNFYRKDAASIPKYQQSGYPRGDAQTLLNAAPMPKHQQSGYPRGDAQTLPYAIIIPKYPESGSPSEDAQTLPSQAYNIVFNEDLQLCQFPFKFENQMYHDCFVHPVTEDLVCPNKVDGDLNPLGFLRCGRKQKKLGNCLCRTDDTPHSYHFHNYADVYLDNSQEKLNDSKEEC